MKGVLGGGGSEEGAWVLLALLQVDDAIRQVVLVCVCVCVCVCARARAQYTYVGIRIHTVRSGGDQGSGHWKQ